eukprot:SAG25_NODE_1598_length_2699_cov_4.434231_1_plen_414_part_00
MEIEPPPWTNETVAEASKRDIVVYLRASMASVPKFLEKHRLKGQEKAVVKGSRMPALKTAYADFLEMFAAMMAAQEGNQPGPEESDPRARLRALLEEQPAPAPAPEGERSRATDKTTEPLLRAEDYAAALGDVSALSRAAVAQGRALLAPLLEQLMDSERGDPGASAFSPPLDMFMLAQRLEPDNAEAKSEAEKLEKILEALAQSSSASQQHNHPEPLDVVIVGAGASGVGVALMLTRVFGLDARRVVLVERGSAVGETFRRWPREMRFISPSFNHQGWTASFDLNSVAYGTSPAFTLHAEHPTGEQYATYLGALAEAAKLRIRTNTEVTAVRSLRAKGGGAGGGGGAGFEVDIASRDLFDGGSAAPLPQPSETGGGCWRAATHGTWTSPWCSMGPGMRARSTRPSQCVRGRR